MKNTSYAIALICVTLIYSSVIAADAIKPSDTEKSAMASQGDSVPPYAVSEPLAAEGEELYKRRCGACHSLDNNRIGPRHRGVYGRKAGAVTDFKYSKALKKLDVVWTDQMLDEWLANPTAFAKGTSMGYRLKKADERKAIIEYLKSLSSARDHSVTAN
jgi:cytochrome c